MLKNLVITLTVIFMSLNILAANKDNPFFKDYDTPFGVPPFDKIKLSHYMPAFEEGMKQQINEINAITSNSAEPSFDNVIVALEQTGALMDKVSSVFYNMMSANTSKELQDIAKMITPKMSKHRDDIMLNEKLFEKVKSVYDNKDGLDLNVEELRLLEETYKNFIRNGAALNAEEKLHLRAVNEEMSLLTLNFGQNVLAENNEFQLWIDKEDDLAGLPKSSIDGAAQAATEAGKKGRWLFTLHNPSWVPFMSYSEKRELREKMFWAYANRGNNRDKNDNSQIILRLINLRQEKARMLGFVHHADYVLADNMAKEAENVNRFLNELWNYANPMAEVEARHLQEIIDREGGDFMLAPWDWRFYAEKLRKEKYDLNEEELRPYFQLEKVRDGIFELTKRLFGLTYKLRNDIPKYHQDAIVYEVKKEDGSHLGILYMDFHPRASKRGGAWMSSYRQQHKKADKNITPVTTIVCNFSGATADKPALLTMDEVETFFHEFGHALHGLLSDCRFKSLSGTSVPRDFVELPSQIMENWAFEPEVLAFYAKHYKTGELLPKSLIEKMEKSSKFNQGFATTEYLAAALLDMKYHTLEAPIGLNPIDFEEEYLTSIGLIPEIIARYRSTYFNHIFSGGYSAGYYSYIWSGVLDSDAYEAFKENGIFDKATAQSFMDNILKKGGTEDPMELYRKFRGREPMLEPLLKKRGLIQ
ncbi:MAG: M3 family metallopeptidase [Candidatus Kapabacteria bacterium]|nr:M3 family metallopeptidase [Ignavibacteriota bacterium]MCW5884266.1 M3 family metallopeptidase [Candidatus Kapabacteria bacterium]